MNQYEMKKLAYQSNLRNRALQVLLYLIDRANKEQTCFPAVRTIARELHISVSTVKRAMQELVESGYVTKRAGFEKVMEDRHPIFIRYIFRRKWKKNGRKRNRRSQSRFR